MSKKKNEASRRDFLKMTATGAPAAVAVTLVGQKASATEIKAKGGLKRDQYYYKYLETTRF